MAVRVQVPCRLRVDPESVLGADDLLCAFQAAMGRAVDRATREVVAPRGAMAVLAPDAPVFRWSGPAVDRVPAAGRRTLEERLRQAVLDAMAAVAVTVAPGEEAPDPPSERVGEPFNESRSEPTLGTYRLPSYDGGGSDKKVRVDGPRPGTPPPRRVRHTWRPVQPRTDADLAVLIREAVRQFGEPPPRGIMMRERAPGGGLQWTVFIYGSPRTVFHVPGFSGYSAHRHGRTLTFTEEPAQPPAVLGTAERRPVADRAGLMAVVDALMGNGIQAQYERAVPFDPDTETQDEYNLVVARAVTDEVARRVDAVLANDGRPVTPTGVIIVTFGSTYTILVTQAADDVHLHWTGAANLLPIANEVPLRPGEEEEGDGGEAGGGTEGRGTLGGARGGGGGGDGTPGEDGTGTGRGSGDGSGTARPPARGGFVFDPSAPTAENEGEGSRFPVVGQGGDPLVCEAFQGEPPLTALGSDGEGLKRVIDDISFRLQIQPCYFAANFCLMAAAALRSRGHDISLFISSTEREAFTQPVPEGNGELGALRIHPVASPGMQFLRHLAGVVPRLHGLALAVMRTYEMPAHWAQINSDWTSPVSWNLHFLEEFTPSTERAVGELFVSASQAMLLQLLLASRPGIEQRIANFTQYAPIFERLMVSQLTDYPELDRLRDRLRHHEAARWVLHTTDAAGGDVTVTAAVNRAVAATDPATAWFIAARALSGAFLAVEAANTTAGAAGEIVETNGVARIRDSHGVMWTVAEIEQAMVLQRGQAEGIDPLVKQITNIPDVLERFIRDRTAIRTELWRVLQEMRSNNTEMLGKAKADAWFAFRSSRIADNIPSATIPGSRYALQGIHLQVHQQLGQFFGGDSFYASGVDYLFSSEEGMQALTGVGITIGIVILCVLCPPLGFAVGAVVAEAEVVHARERARLYGALIDPELVLTRTEVEIELFAAYLGFALSLIPEAGTILGAARRGVRVGLRAGLVAGARSAVRYAVRRAVRQVIEALAKDLLQEFITQIVLTEVLQHVIQKVMEPVLSYLEHEEMVRGAVGGPEGAAFVLMVLGAERRAAVGAP